MRRTVTVGRVNEATSGSHVEVRLYGDLAWFVTAAGRDGVAHLPVGSRRSAKDLLESVGLPHVEVGGVLVDGRRADLDDLVVPGTRLSVYPAGHELAPSTSADPDPPDPRRFVADVHLGTLARRLRLLGFDTWYETHADDDLLADLSVDERRILLTRDRQLLMRRRVEHGYCPRSSDPDRQLLEVVSRYDLRSRTAPYTRCAECNATLAAATLEEVRDRVPARVAETHERFSRCDGCGRVYWPGSHLDALAELHPELFG